MFSYFILVDHALILFVDHTRYRRNLSRLFIDITVATDFMSTFKRNFILAVMAVYDFNCISHVKSQPMQERHFFVG